MKMNCWSPVGIVMITIVLIFAFQPNLAEAKRGCATFGHSCYGGMGKRASEFINVDNNEELLQDIQQNNDENIVEDPAFVFTGPRNGYKPRRLTPQQYEHMSRIIKQWIQSYRRAQELQQDNNI